MRRADVLLVALLATAFPLLDCATLEALPDGTCGNGVVDPTEDCDTFSPVGRCGRADEGDLACRVVCDPAKPACPDGWGCSAAGVCRQPTGEFEPPGPPLESGVTSLAVGDFDGDHRMDLLGSGERGADNAARMRVLYFGAEARLSSVHAFAAPVASPVVRDLDGDGRSDLAFGAGGLNIALGQVERSFLPVLFPSFEQDGDGLVPVKVRAGTTLLPDGTLEALLAVVALPAGDGARVSVLATLGEGYAAPLPGSPRQVVGLPATGRVLDGLQESGCGDVVIALAITPPSLVVASPCRVPGPTPERARWWSERAPVVATLPAEPIRGPVIADVDHDGHEDVLVTTKLGTYVVRSTGTALLAPVRPEARGSATLFDEDGVLAAEDLNADGWPDYLVPAGVLLSTPSSVPVDGGDSDVRYDFFRVGRSPRWSGVVRGSLNADPYPDFVATTADAPDLDFVAGAPFGGLVPSTVSTSGPVAQISAGDVDGDTVVDLAVTTTHADGHSELAVAYGRLVGPPEPARMVGRVEDVSYLEVVGPVGGAAHTFVFSTRPVSDGSELLRTRVSVLVGSGDRQPAAPLLLAGDAEPREWRPHTVLAGPMRQPGRLDLYAIAVGEQERTDGARRPPALALWKAEGTGPLTFGSAVLSQSLDLLTPLFTERSGALQLVAVSGDLDAPKDGVEEAVVLSAAPGGDACLYAFRGGDAAAPSTLVLPARLGPRNALALTDVDGDGIEDAIVLVGGSERASCWSRSETARAASSARRRRSWSLRRRARRPISTSPPSLPSSRRAPSPAGRAAQGGSSSSPRAAASSGSGSVTAASSARRSSFRRGSRRSRGSPRATSTATASRTWRSPRAAPCSSSVSARGCREGDARAAPVAGALPRARARLGAGRAR